MLGIFSAKWKNAKFVLDLSMPNCHICGRRLVRNMSTEKECCVNLSCQVRGIKFNIPYKQEGEG